MNKKLNQKEKIVKSSIRNFLKNKRKKLEKQEVIEKSKKIKEKLFSIPEFQSANSIAFYVSIKRDNEVETEEMIKDSLKLGKRIFIPLVDIKQNKIKFSEITDLNELNIGIFGILEPKKKLRRIVSNKVIKLIILPGIAFDLQGYRVGYGYGFYDKFLHQIKSSVIKIGLAFEFQVIKNLPTESHDIKVNKIITESDIIECK